MVNKEEFGTFLALAFKGITTVSRQVKIQDYQIDILFPEYGIIVEYDDHTIKDDERDNILTFLGYTVIKIKKHESYAIILNHIFKSMQEARRISD